MQLIEGVGRTEIERVGGGVLISQEPTTGDIASSVFIPFVLITSLCRTLRELERADRIDEAARDGG